MIWEDAWLSCTFVMYVCTNREIIDPIWKFILKWDMNSFVC